MCTVTYIPKSKLDYILTSNRDENSNRAKALQPNTCSLNDVNVLFPQDTAKGGTWIGVTENNRTVCLLNGGFEKHTPTNDYIKSRGLIVLDFLTAADSQLLLNTIDLNKIEPFTLILIDVNIERSLVELKWDGVKKHITQLDSHLPHIWSSCTLYNLTETKYKAKLFHNFYNASLNAKNLFDFHNYGTIKEPELMGYINPISSIQTISVTQIIKTKNCATMVHKNIVNGTTNQEIINFNKTHSLVQ